MSFSIAELSPQDVEPYISIAGESLLGNNHSNWMKYLDRVGQENVRVVRYDQDVVGGLAMYRMGQWFGGESIPCAGFSGVAISPAHRGTGACRIMLETVIRELHQIGCPLASLYASTQSLYRTVGFEHAGGNWQYSIPMSSLRSFDRELTVTRYVEPPIDIFNTLANRRAARCNGHLDRTPGLWQRVIAPYDTTTTSYLIGTESNPVGYAIFKEGDYKAGLPQGLVASDVCAITGEAAKRILTLVYDHRSMLNEFKWPGGPSDLFHLLAAEQWLKVTDHMRWMLRIIDLPKALASRGYHGDSGELSLRIIDPLIQENNGDWVLKVVDGQASIGRGGTGALELNIQALAPLYSSLLSASDLHRLGWIRCSLPEQVYTADRLFRGPAPWLPEHF